jgi:hypothetical protein
MTLFISWKPTRRICSDSVLDGLRSTGQRCRHFDSVSNRDEREEASSVRGDGSLEAHVVAGRNWLISAVAPFP